MKTAPRWQLLLTRNYVDVGGLMADITQDQMAVILSAISIFINLIVLSNGRK